MKLKAKIRLALLGAFLVLAIIGTIGGTSLDRLTDGMVVEVQRNLYFMGHTREMGLAINEIVSTMSMTGVDEGTLRVNLRQAESHFLRNFNLMATTANEADEIAITDALRENFDRFMLFAENMISDSTTVSTELINQSVDIQGLLKQVYMINEDSIEDRIDNAYKTADRVTIILLIGGFLFFLFAVIAMFYVPEYMASPIVTISTSLQSVANKNYDERIEINTNDEIGDMARSFNMMAEKLGEYDKLNVNEILSEKQRTEAIINRMREAIIGVDANFEVLFANKTVLGLLQMESEQVVGRKVEEVAAENALMTQLFREVLQQEVKPGNRSFPGITFQKGGKTYYFERDILRIGAQANDQKTGTPVGYVIIMKNVTEFREQDIAKTNFMASLSHELKTPISAIDMSLGLMSDERIGNLNEEQKDLAHTIRQNSQRLLTMVNDILDMSKIETGNITLQEEDVLPSDIVERALASTKGFFEEKKVPLQVDVEESLPLLHVDMQKTVGVLINFLTNALRYSQAGEAIQIHC
ncbi:MAG: histidine kinase dimerization/phospho-acceptor domain-containing protein [Bacteroidota bacterium]